MENFAVLPPQSKLEVPTPERNDRSSLEAAREQVERILASDTLRASEAVRRLLRFLSEQSLSGQADQLKEYSIGVDGLGKPPSFDPRHDAGVRLLASRVRLKLDEYYSREGLADHILIELPRGRFKITWKARLTDVAPLLPATVATVASPGTVPTAPVPDAEPWNGWRALSFVLAFACLSLTATCVWFVSRPARVTAVQASPAKSFPELEALWSPFISSANHVVIAFWNPVFVRLQRNGKPDILFRQSGRDDWDDILRMPEYAGLKRLIGNSTPKPTLNFTMRGSLVSIFALSQFFASHRSDVSLTRLDQLSWQQVADHNIVLIAPYGEVHQRLAALPATPAFIVEKTGIRNLQPSAGEPKLYEDFDDPQQSDGEAVELVSMMPGPLGRTRVLSFAGTKSSGLIGSVQSLTDPAFARLVVSKLRRSGPIPLYFQMILKVKYRDETPTDVTYVTHRCLTLHQNPSSN